MLPFAPQVAHRFGRRLVAGLVACVIACSVTEDAWAQRPDDTTLQAELERTDQIIERAADVVKRSGIPRALNLLEFAASLQKKAWAAFRDERPRLAIDYTRRARETAKQAIQIATHEIQLAERARRVLEDAEHALERARLCVEDSPSDRALRALHMASERLERAREALHEHKFQIVTEISLHVRRMLEEVCNRRPVRQVERLIENVERLLERAFADLDSSDEPGALALLAKSREQLAQAKEQLRAGRPEAAARLARQAKELVLRAIRLTETPPSVDRVDRILEDTATYIEDLAQRVGDAGVREAEILMERALEHLHRARELRLEGKLRRALAETRVARNLARRAASMAGVQEL